MVVVKIPNGWSWMAFVGAGALVCAGVAIAKHQPASTAAVAATFTATTVAERNTATCTGADGTYEVTRARYTGTASSADGRLDGTLELRVRSIYNTTTNLGWLTAHAKVRDASGKTEAHGKLRAVNANGQVEGLLTGGVHGPNGRLLANVGAAYTSAGGFTAGQLGTGGATNTAIVHGGGCTDMKPGGHESKQHSKPSKEDKRN